jgi:hypothetical protein
MSGVCKHGCVKIRLVFVFFILLAVILSTGSGVRRGGGRSRRATTNSSAGSTNDRDAGNATTIYGIDVLKSNASAGNTSASSKSGWPDSPHAGSSIINGSLSYPVPLPNSTDRYPWWPFHHNSSGAQGHSVVPTYHWLYYQENFMRTFKEYMPICRKAGQNVVLSRNDGINVDPATELRPWSFSLESYARPLISGIELSQSLSVCNTTEELLRSAMLGQRLRTEDIEDTVLFPLFRRHVFHPYKCAYKWFNPKELCAIMSKYAVISTVGDTIIRQTKKIMIMLTTDDWSHGALGRVPTSARGERVYEKCTCDGQMSESETCRDNSVLDTILNINSSYEYGICGSSQKFGFLWEGDHMETKHISDRCMHNGVVDYRPRLVLLHFGLHLQLNPEQGIDHLKSVLRRFGEAQRKCPAMYDLHFIWISEEPEHEMVYAKYPIRSEESIASFNKAMSDFIDTLRPDVNIWFLNSTEITRHGEYADGVHPLTETTAIRAMYIFNLMNII